MKDLTFSMVCFFYIHPTECILEIFREILSTLRPGTGVEGQQLFFDLVVLRQEGGANFGAMGDNVVHCILSSIFSAFCCIAKCCSPSFFPPKVVEFFGAEDADDFELLGRL